MFGHYIKGTYFVIPQQQQQQQLLFQQLGSQPRELRLLRPEL